jgi:hypothetical protein
VDTDVSFRKITVRELGTQTGNVYEYVVKQGFIGRADLLVHFWYSDAKHCLHSNSRFRIEGKVVIINRL